MDDLSKSEAGPGEVADTLRANARINSAAYSIPVLGASFLHHADLSYFKPSATPPHP